MKCKRYEPDEHKNCIYDIRRKKSLSNCHEHCELSDDNIDRLMREDMSVDVRRCRE